MGVMLGSSTYQNQAYIILNKEIIGSHYTQWLGCLYQENINFRSDYLHSACTRC